MKNRTVFLAISFFFVGVFLSIEFSQYTKKESEAVSLTTYSEDKGQVTYVTPEQFGAGEEGEQDDAEAIQKAIDFSAKSDIGLVRLTGNKTYVLEKGLIIREKVELRLDQNTKIQVSGDFRVLELERNASITNGIIEVVSPTFTSEVVYMDGHTQHWSTERTRVHNLTIVNLNEKHQGTAIYLSANKKGEYISFVNISDLNINGFYNGIHIEASNGKAGEPTWISGNRFTNITLDYCVRCIELSGDVSGKNETSGNQFSNLQIQISKVTERAIVVTGSSNRIDGIVWDAHLAPGSSLIELNSKSAYNRIDLNLNHEYIVNKGNQNNVLESR
ncbi:glycoside hydrolase family 55 protein [Guptibacillus algicola]|uniref:glycoside hydrolase family 55 protein n=1 Tax=Guptibacillus algicola TaxID=225844 RepID=UPI001CD73AEC|nr:glycoside hydrolase family 55 protein [Alkalihalobacillus algicola]MCA0987040.1 glycoside hydrolase family 55 protein [Alkalihalobacillus algicola]